MGDPWDKSKRQLSGNSGKQRSRSFYLDECFECREVKDVLDNKGVKYRSYSQDVKQNSGVQDEIIVPYVGKKIFLTQDADQPRKRRIRAELQRFGVRTFVLPADISAASKAELVAKHKNSMFALVSLREEISSSPQ
jgi:hypothetical protein